MIPVRPSNGVERVVVPPTVPRRHEGVQDALERVTDPLEHPPHRNVVDRSRGLDAECAVLAHEEIGYQLDRRPPVSLASLVPEQKDPELEDAGRHRMLWAPRFDVTDEPATGLDGEVEPAVDEPARTVDKTREPPLGRLRTPSDGEEAGVALLLFPQRFEFVGTKGTKPDNGLGHRNERNR
jgi:hypothetical protein